MGHPRRAVEAPTGQPNPCPPRGHVCCPMGWSTCVGCPPNNNDLTCVPLPGKLKTQHVASRRGRGLLCTAKVFERCVLSRRVPRTFLTHNDSVRCRSRTCDCSTRSPALMSRSWQRSPHHGPPQGHHPTNACMHEAVSHLHAMACTTFSWRHFMHAPCACPDVARYRRCSAARVPFLRHLHTVLCTYGTSNVPLLGLPQSLGKITKNARCMHECRQRLNLHHGPL